MSVNVFSPLPHPVLSLARLCGARAGHSQALEGLRKVQVPKAFLFSIAPGTLPPGMSSVGADSRNDPEKFFSHHHRLRVLCNGIEGVMEEHEAMTIREIAMGHLEHAIVCIGVDDMAAVLVLHNCKKSLEKMDSAEQLEYQQMLETLSIQPPRPISSRAAMAHMERVYERLRRWDSRRR